MMLGQVIWGGEVIEEMSLGKSDQCDSTRVEEKQSQ